MTKAVLDDWRTAPIAEPLKAMLGFLEVLTLRPDQADGAAARAVLDAGVSEEAFEDAVATAALFNMIDRLADTFEFDVPSPAQFHKQGQMLLKRGYL